MDQKSPCVGQCIEHLTYNLDKVLVGVDNNLDKVLVGGEPLGNPGAQPAQEKNHRQVCQPDNLPSNL